VTAAPPVIRTEVLAAVRRAAEAAYPEECCGLLLGRRDGARLAVDEAVASANLSPRPRDSFEIDPRLRLRLHKALRGTGREVLGHYHSHPDAPASPSARDRAQAWEPDLLWLIVAVPGGRAGELAAFFLDGRGAAVAVPLASDG
jgi:proteasome lid subunit RPN8/RPN11